MQELDNQYFTYRQSPALVNGKARIKSIKGNTLVWNQLVTDAHIHVQQSTALAWSTFANFTFSLKNGHKYLIRLLGQTVTGGQIGVRDIDEGIVYRPNTGYTVIYTATKDTNNTTIIQGKWTEGTTDAYFNIFDLTMNGFADNVDQFTSLFPLNYYAYGQYLLNFNGTGIKTTGKNLLDFNDLQIGKNWTKSSAVDRAIIEFAVEENKEYTISFDYSSNVSNAILVFRTGWNTDQISNSDVGSAKEYTFTTPLNCKVLCVQFNARVNGFVLSQNDFYGLWNCALTETFTTNVLPISTYFPNGMMGWGTAFDELTNSKAIHRMIEIDMGDCEWQTGTYAYYTTPYNPSMKTQTSNAVCDCFVWVDKTTYSLVEGEFTTKAGAGKSIWFPKGSYATASDFKTAMAGHKIQYELDTYTEQDVDPEDTQILLNRALSTILGRNVSVDNPQEPLDILTKGE